MMISAIFVIWIGSLFVYAGSLKIVEFGRGKAGLAQYALIPRQAAAPIALVLPGLELAVGTGLLSGRFRVPSALLAAALGLAFAALAAHVLRAGEVVPCGCAGQPDEVVSWTTALRGAAIFAAALVVVFVAPAALSTPVRGAVFVAALLPAGWRLSVRLHARALDAETAGRLDHEIGRLSALLEEPRS